MEGAILGDFHLWTLLSLKHSNSSQLAYFLSNVTLWSDQLLISYCRLVFRQITGVVSSGEFSTNK